MLWEASFPQHREAIERVPPALHGRPFLGLVFQRQINHFQRSLLAGERAPRLEHPAQAHIQALNRVGRIDGFVNLTWALPHFW